MCVATVEKPAVVRDNQRRSSEPFEGILQGPQGVHVQIIARLVQQEHIGAGFQHLGQVDAIALATGERADFLLLIRSGQIEARHIGA